MERYQKIYNVTASVEFVFPGAAREQAGPVILKVPRLHSGQCHDRIEREEDRCFDLYASCPGDGNKLVPVRRSPRVCLQRDLDLELSFPEWNIYGFRALLCGPCHVTVRSLSVYLPMAR